MPVDGKSSEIEPLNRAECMLLVGEFWDNVAGESESLEVQQSHKDELDRRLSGYADDPHSGSSWEDAKARLEM